MRIIVLILFSGFLFSSAQADQTGQLLLNPYHPEFNTDAEDMAPLLDANLQNELVRFSEQRDRIQKLWLEHMPADPGLIQSNSFVLKRVMDRSFSRLSQSEYFKKTRLGRAGEQMKSKMETRVAFKDEKNIDHKFDFKLAAFQGQAFIQYSGFTKAQLRYDVRDGGRVAMILQHDLSKNSIIGIETSVVGRESYQLMTLNFVW